MDKFTLASKDKNNLLSSSESTGNPCNIGTVLMYHVAKKYPIEERMGVIRSILENFSTDFLIHELPRGEVKRIRKIINMI